MRTITKATGKKSRPDENDEEVDEEAVDKEIESDSTEEEDMVPEEP